MELGDRLGESLPPLYALELSIQILRGLEHAHAAGVIHRDLKPENIFLTRDHEGNELPKIVDFGIAKMLHRGESEREEESLAPLTRLGVVFGTPKYMSPEQATGMEVDARTDLYALGLVLYEMLSGTPPFENDDPVALLRMQVSLDPAPLPDSIPSAIRDLTLRLLEKDREARFASATETREAFEALLQALESDPASHASIAALRRDTGKQKDLERAQTAGPPAADSGASRLAETPASLLKKYRVSPRHLTIGGAGGLLLVALFMLWPESNAADEGPSPAGSNEPELSQAEAIPDFADRLAEIDRHLLAKNSEEALLIIKPLRDDFPEDAALIWREAKALSLNRNKRSLALTRYGEAAEADPSLLDDREFYAELYELLENRKLRDQAVDLALQKLGKHGHTFLLEKLNDENATRALPYGDRHRAIDELSGDPESSKLINHKLNLARDLWQAFQAPDPCAAYAQALTAIREQPDPYFVDILEKTKLPESKKEGSDCSPLTPQLEATRLHYTELYAEATKMAPTAKRARVRHRRRKRRRRARAKTRNRVRVRRAALRRKKEEPLSAARKRHSRRSQLTMRPLILASTSPYRAELLARLEVPFQGVAHRFDEERALPRFEALGPEDFALHLARGKAQSLSESYGDAWILAADQIGVLEGEDGNSLLRKPGREAAAIEQLMRMSGRQHRLITAVVLLDAQSGAEHHAVDRQHLTMRPFDRGEATRYVEKWRPVDCAGSYRIEDAGIKLFSDIQSSDFTGIIGLPLLAVARLLREAKLLPGAESRA